MTETGVEVAPKAYDVKVLLEKLKEHGLEVAEEAAGAVIISVTDWIVESAPLSKTPFDDVLVAIMPVMKKELLKAADKIDGQEG